MKGALTDSDIKRIIGEGFLLVDPFVEENIQPASIDLNLGNIQYKYNLKKYVLGELIDETKNFEKSEFQDLYLENGDTAFVGINEKIQIPDYTLGLVMPRSSITRLGIHIVPVYMNPGYTGYMPLTIINHTGITITLKPMRRVAQLILFPLSSSPAKVYNVRSDAKYRDENVKPSQLHTDRELNRMVDEIFETEAPILSSLVKKSS